MERDHCNDTNRGADVPAERVDNGIPNPQVLASLIFDLLREVDSDAMHQPLVDGDPADGELTLVDGQFDLRALASRLNKRLNQLISGTP